MQDTINKVIIVFIAVVTICLFVGYKEIQALKRHNEFSLSEDRKILIIPQDKQTVSFRLWQFYPMPNDPRKFIPIYISEAEYEQQVRDMQAATRKVCRAKRLEKYHRRLQEAANKDKFSQFFIDENRSLQSVYSYVNKDNFDEFSELMYTMLAEEIDDRNAPR